MGTGPEGTPRDERYRRTLVQMMEGHARRELAAARLFGQGLAFVPELRWLKLIAWHTRQEIEHYEAVACIYAELTDRSVEPQVHAQLERRPLPAVESWYELGMAQFLFDRGGFWQLREYEACSYPPYRQIIQKILEEELGHQALGERIVVDLGRDGQFDEGKQAIFEKWLRQGLLSFGRPGSHGARYAVSVGLRRRDPAEAMQDFLDDIKPAVRAAGLSIPPLELLGIEAPPGLSASLDGMDNRFVPPLPETP